MAIDIEWVRETPEEAARQMDMLKNMSSDIQLMTSFVSEGRWAELAMLSSNPELAKLGEALNKLQVKHLTQVVDLVEQREQHRAAEEAQIALRKKAYDERDSLAAYQDDLVRELTACQAVLHNLAHDRQVTPDYANDAKAVLKRKPTASLALRDAMMRVEGARIVAARALERHDFLNLGNSERERVANHATLISNELFQESKWGAQ